MSPVLKKSTICRALDGHALLLKLLLGDEILNGLLGAHQILDGHGLKACGRGFHLHAVAVQKRIHLLLVVLVDRKAHQARAYADQNALDHRIIPAKHHFFLLSV